jgi:hypothetical protein
MTSQLGLEPGDDGHAIGRDPRRMTQNELRALGHQPMSAQEALRARCLDCCAGSPSEVRYCAAVECPSWPFRMGKSPWRSPPSEARREAGRALAARMAQKSENSGQEPTSSATSDGAATALPDGTGDDA